MGLFFDRKSTGRLEDLEENLRKLKMHQENLELEWINFLDKAKRMLARIVKRAEVVEAAEPQPSAGDNGPTGAGSLSPRAAQIQAQILARRAKLTERG